MAKHALHLKFAMDVNQEADSAMSSIRKTLDGAIQITALQRRAVLRVAAWQAFDALWREIRSNFGDFEEDYREWKASGGLNSDVDAVERAAFVLYDALRADTVACRSEDELSYLDRFTGPKLRHVALEWFREDRESREAPHG